MLLLGTTLLLKKFWIAALLEDAFVHTQNILTEQGIRLYQTVHFSRSRLRCLRARWSPGCWPTPCWGRTTCATPLYPMLPSISHTEVRLTSMNNFQSIVWQRFLPPVPGGQGSFMGFSYIKKLREASKTWFVYVHDIHEHVLLHTFGIGNPTHVTMSTTQLHQEFVAARALVTPELYTYPDTSHHPCNSSHSYSSSQCWLNSAWSKRLTRLRGAFGSDMVRCMLPGVLPRPEDVLPICQHSRQSGNISGLGLMDLTRVHHDDETLNATETPIMLASPPIGSELEELANGLAGND